VALMGWEDGLLRWMDGLIAAHPGLDVWLESHLHTLGYHGPALRHLLRSRVLPVAVLAVLTPLPLLAGLRAGRALRTVRTAAARARPSR
jgi:hypothetical protein